MGVEAVSYMPSLGAGALDFRAARSTCPYARRCLRTSARYSPSTPATVARGAVTPRIANPDVTVPSRYRELFGEIEAATAGASGTGEAARIVQAARALLLEMRSDFEALETSRTALLKA